MEVGLLVLCTLLKANCNESEPWGRVRVESPSCIGPFKASHTLTTTENGGRSQGGALNVAGRSDRVVGALGFEDWR